jgi:hypothetical protein
MTDFIKEQAAIYQDFHDFMNQEHGLILIISQMDEIIYEVGELTKKLEHATKRTPITKGVHKVV